METLELPQEKTHAAAPLKLRLVQLKAWAAAHRRPLTLGLIAVIISALWAGYQYIYLPTFTGSGPLSSSSSATKAEPRNIPNPINGLLYTASEAAVWKDRTPLAVVIENSTDSRPQSGLTSADLVYEALAEGGITRQLAIYLTVNGAVSVGPLRSMRTYFLDWLAEYKSVAVHVGGNVHALDRLSQENFKDINGIYYGEPTFIRTTDRFAPHNDYSYTSLLWAEATRKGYTGATSFRSWTFKDDTPPVPASATVAAHPAHPAINLGFLGDPGYKVTWTYQLSSNSYLKNVGGSPLVDKNDNQQISAKVVIVQVIPYTLFPEPGGALNMRGIGSGTAYVFQDGGVTTGTWHKTDVGERTIFTDKNGQEITLDRGQIWIEIIPPNTPISY